jgi:hypothetical protein
LGMGFDLYARASVTGRPTPSRGAERKSYRYRCPATRSEVGGATTAEPFRLDGATLVAAVRCMCGGIHLVDWTTGALAASQTKPNSRNGRDCDASARSTDYRA